LFEWICKFNGTTNVIDNLDVAEVALEQELTEDLLSVTHHFSGQMYALRSHATIQKPQKTQLCKNCAQKDNADAKK
jgi:predicted site-specific integrase-resolvase